MGKCNRHLSSAFGLGSSRRPYYREKPILRNAGRVNFRQDFSSPAARYGSWSLLGVEWLCSGSGIGDIMRGECAEALQQKPQDAGFRLDLPPAPRTPWRGADAQDRALPVPVRPGAPQQCHTGVCPLGGRDCVQTHCMQLSPHLRTPRTDSDRTPPALGAVACSRPRAETIPENRVAPLGVRGLSYSSFPHLRARLGLGACLPTKHQAPIPTKINLKHVKSLSEEIRAKGSWTFGLFLQESNASVP